MTAELNPGVKRRPNRSVCIYGTFPPPVDGMALVNRAVFQILSNEDGLAVVGLDTVPDGAYSGPFWYAARLLKVVSALGGLLWCCTVSRAGTLYASLSSGLGQLSDLAAILVARSAGWQVVLHHHSYAYLRTRRALVSLMCRCAGRRADHIVLCADMQTRLASLYPEVTSVTKLCNAGFVQEPAPARVRRCCTTVGFLGNISEDKGIWEVFGTAAACAESAGAEALSFLIAGAVRQREVEGPLRRRVASSPNVRYLGPCYGEDKARFFESIDVLLFPSTYAVEAQPLTVLEAMASSIPVIAWERGCIGQLVSRDVGFLVPTDADFQTTAVQILRAWQRQPSVFQAVSAAARRRYEQLRLKSERDVALLIERLHARSRTSAGSDCSC